VSEEHSNDVEVDSVQQSAVSCENVMFNIEQNKHEPPHV